MYKKIKDTVSLYRFQNNINLLDDPKLAASLIQENPHDFYYFKLPKGDVRRNLFASLIKKLRAENPFQPENYTKAKELYDAYFKMEGHIPSFEHILNEVKSGKEFFVTRFRSEAPVKGERFAEYHINGSYSNSTTVYQLMEPSESETYINMNDPEGFANTSAISVDFFTNYRYSTKEEIEKFKQSTEEIKILRKEIDKKQEEVNNLWKNLHSLRKVNC
jgi:hypothetical protein